MTYLLIFCAVSNPALKFTRVVGNKLNNGFEVNGENTPEAVCDIIRHQWMTYQNEDIPDSYFRLEENNKSTSGRIQYSYWEHALECFHLTTITTSVSSQYKKVDHYWLNVNNIVDSKGRKKYTQLFCLAFCLFSLSHGNSTPERGFSINKVLLESHGYTMQNDTISVLRFIKDELNRVGGILNFPITQNLITQVKGARAKYMADLEETNIGYVKKKKNE